MRKEVRKKLYKTLIQLHYETKFKHVGSSFSVLDIIATIWIDLLTSKDSFLLSKGHSVTALYTVLYHKGYLSKDELYSFHKDGSQLGGHPSAYFPQYIPFPSGSLGHGLSLACGIAQGHLLQKSEDVPHVYCVMSDGECNVGQVWEAAQYASGKNLDNLIAIIDRNKLQAFGRPKEVIGDAATQHKWTAFGWDVYKIDGHNPAKLRMTLEDAKKDRNGKPKVIIANTIKGHGIRVAHDKLAWHYKSITDEVYQSALEELDRILEESN